MIYGRTKQTHRAAIQEFCQRHKITETSAKELEKMIGMPYRQVGRILGDLGWDLIILENKTHKRRCNGDTTEFSRLSTLAVWKLLGKFEHHYEQYKLENTQNEIQRMVKNEITVGN